MSEATFEFLEWDSNFFGRRIGRIAGARLRPQDLRNADAFARSNQLDCVYCLADPNDAIAIRELEQRAYRLVDIRLTLDRDCEPLQHNSAPQGPAIAPASEQDLPALRTIARSAHRDSRFYFDQNFTAEQCDRLYEQWIENSLRGLADAVLVAHLNEDVAGYITCLGPRNDRFGQIGLFAVAEFARGQGVGGKLIVEALRWFQSNHCETVRVVTQGRNVSAQRVYQKSGFRTCDVALWYHKWFENPST